MPFSAPEIVSKFTKGRDAERLGHAYLITGRTLVETESMVSSLAAILLGESSNGHPDFHTVRPESKSRRITVAQVRELERVLYLKAFKAPHKIAAIIEADRMCLGQAEPANAFLKTLEEPPEHTTLFLTTCRVSAVLPTLLSRCLRLDILGGEIGNPHPAIRDLVNAWFSESRKGALRAYARAATLQGCWRVLRAEIETDDAAQDEEIAEEAAEASLESEFLLARQESIASLQRHYWTHFRDSLPTPRSITLLEDLQTRLQQNVDPNLAVERACLAIEGLI
jgi:DNA polymerase-3 subunit delta'